MDLAKRAVKGFLRQRGYQIRRLPRYDNPSETAKCRARLAKYCTGSGIDIGPGGDPITLGAVRVDLPQPYTRVGDFPVQLGGDAGDLYWFRDGVLDYVYSSHVLEDFVDTEGMLREWLRVLKVGGNLVIYCPDEQVYRKHCDTTGQCHNPHHKLEQFSLQYVEEILGHLFCTETVHRCPLIDVYSWELVAKKTAAAALR
jgi:SAM-dependent methyltransferase